MTLLIESVTIIAEISLSWFFFSKFFSGTRVENTIFLACYSIIDFIGTFFLTAPLRILLFAITIFCFNFFYFHIKATTVFYVVLIHFTSAILADVLCSLPFPYLNLPADYILNDVIGRLIYNSCAKLVHLIMLMFILFFMNIRKKTFFPAKTIPLILCHLASVFILYINFQMLISTHNYVTTTIITIALLYINIVLCYYVDFLQRSFEEHEKLAMAEQQLCLNQEFYDDLLHRQEETRSLWHDIKKYMLAMENLVNDNNLKEARNEFSAIETSFQNLRYTVDSGNPIIDGILNHEMLLAKNKNIDCSLDIWIDCELKIEATDLYVILGNTIDNAIEACANLPEDATKTIHIKLRQKEHILLYEITNPYTPTKHKNVSKRFHGYGLYNVRRCVEHNHGTLTTNASEGQFTVSVLLNV